MLSTGFEKTGSKKGYLDVKVPAKVRGKGLKAWKAWKKRWVVIHGMTNLATNSPVVTIDMYTHESREGHQLERCTIYLEQIVAIYRTRSKSHPYAFSIEARGTLLYLSGQSETNSQRWIEAFRLILCPKSAMPALNTSIGEVFPVSIIESQSCYAKELLGIVGYIVALPSVVLLAALTDGCILAEWPLTVIHRVSMVHEVSHLEDKDKILKIEIANVVANAGIFHFYSETAVKIVSTLCRSISKYKTSLSIYGTWKLDSAAYTLARKMSEDVTGFRRKQQTSMMANVTPVKAESAEDLLNFIFQSNSAKCRLPNAHSDNQILTTTTTTTEIKQLINNQNKTTTTNIKRRKCSTLTKHSSISSCSDLQVLKTAEESELDEIARLDRLKSCSDSTLLSTTKTKSSVVIHPYHGHNNTNCNLTTSLQKKQKQDGAQNGGVGGGSTGAGAGFGELRIRPLSGYSSTSQVSRDSGVMMMNLDEVPESSSNNCHHQSSHLQHDEVSTSLDIAAEDHICTSNVDLPLPDPQTAADIGSSSGDRESVVAYRHLSEFLQEPDKMVLYQNQPDRLSTTSSDSTLYSEIDTYFFDDKKDDPLYEDLDKFRKNIHKLLGIPEKIGDPVSKSQSINSGASTDTLTPPPLPPRQYKKKKNNMDGELVRRRKDVAKYLGLDKDKFYGSLDKLNLSANKATSSDVQQTPNKRKDIYRYLGIPAMAASQPAGLDMSPEQTYDSPVPRNHCGDLNNKSATLRTTRTYVRTTAVPIRATSTIVEKSPAKKKRSMTFLKRKLSKEIGSNSSLEQKSSSSSSSSSTYISFDICNQDDWDTISKDCCPSPLSPPYSSRCLSTSSYQSSTEEENRQSSVILVEALDTARMSTTIQQNVIEEEQECGDNSTDVEQYSVPRSLTSCLPTCSHCSLYVNIAEMLSTDHHQDCKCDKDEDGADVETTSVQEETSTAEATSKDDECGGRLSNCSIDSSYMDMASVQHRNKESAVLNSSVIAADEETYLEDLLDSRNSDYMEMEVKFHETLDHAEDADNIQEDETSVRIDCAGGSATSDKECTEEQLEGSTDELPAGSTSTELANFDTYRRGNNANRSITSADIPELISRQSLDEELTTKLQTKLSLYIDKLFATSDNEAASSDTEEEEQRQQSSADEDVA